MSTQRPGAVPPAGIARHGELTSAHPARKVFGFLGVAVAVLAISATSVVAVAAARVAENVNNNSVVLETDANGDPIAPPALDELEGGVNLLIVGTDNDANQGEAFGDRGTTTLNDVNMLLHVSEDQSNAVLVSFPRDLIVPIPSCTRTDGTTTYAMSAQPINVAWSTGGTDGGLNCVHSTVEALTGLEIPYAAAISFNGVINMSTAVGGVEVCVSRDIDDADTGLHLDKGDRIVKGASALAFLRTRHGLSDGSDLARISNQQSFLSSLIRTVKSDGTLTDPTKLYGLAYAATKNLHLSTSMTSVDTMVGMAKILSKIDLNKIALVQYPGTTGNADYPGKVVPLYNDAAVLFDAIKADTPVVPEAGNTGAGTVVDPNTPTTPATEDPDTTTATVLPGSITGTTPDVRTCTK